MEKPIASTTLITPSCSGSRCKTSDPGITWITSSGIFGKLNLTELTLTAREMMIDREVPFYQEWRAGGGS